MGKQSSRSKIVFLQIELSLRSVHKHEELQHPGALGVIPVARETLAFSNGIEFAFGLVDENPKLGQLLQRQQGGGMTIAAALNGGFDGAGSAVENTDNQFAPRPIGDIEMGKGRDRRVDPAQEIEPRNQ